MFNSGNLSSNNLLTNINSSTTFTATKNGEVDIILVGADTTIEDELSYRYALDISDDKGNLITRLVSPLTSTDDHGSDSGIIAFFKFKVRQSTTYTLKYKAIANGNYSDYTSATYAKVCYIGIGYCEGG